ncbi:DUF883 domain-containing protein [Glaciecola siphonariae]|uniref:DUF883 domain-containing protein n=1 Tax=Glaciecola siphonariae TaxID=521012 RepID=A0ABV9LU14_9ALTE
MATATNTAKGSVAQKRTKTTQADSSHPVADKIKDTLHDSVETLSEKAASAEQGLRDSMEKGSENFEERKAQMESSWNNSKVKQFAVENPVKTAGLAFAAGALLASFLRSK